MIPQRPAPAGAETGLSIRTQKWLVTASLAFYPTGALLYTALEDRNLGLLLGGSLILLSLVAAAFLLNASLQRIAGARAARLDEFEMMLRRRAFGWSYGVLSGALVAFLLYNVAASEVDLPSPDSGEEFFGLALVALLFTLLLPTAFLAWTLPPSRDEE